MLPLDRREKESKTGRARELLVDGRLRHIVRGSGAGELGCGARRMRRELDRSAGEWRSEAPAGCRPALVAASSRLDRGKLSVSQQAGRQACSPADQQSAASHLHGGRCAPTGQQRGDNQVDVAAEDALIPAGQPRRTCVRTRAAGEPASRGGRSSAAWARALQR